MYSGLCVGVIAGVRVVCVCKREEEERESREQSGRVAEQIMMEAAATREGKSGK